VMADDVNKKKIEIDHIFSLCRLNIIKFLNITNKKKHYRKKKKKKKIEIKMCVLIFSKILSGTFVILRKIHRDKMINLYWSPCKKYPLFLSDFNFLEIFSKNPQMLRKIHPVGAGFHAENGEMDGRRTDRETRQTDMTKLMVAFRRFAKAPKNLSSWNDSN